MRMLGPELNLGLKFHSGDVMAWINLANLECDWVTVLVKAICQNITLNTSATQSGTATRRIIIVLVLVKYSVLQVVFTNTAMYFHSSSSGDCGFIFLGIRSFRSFVDLTWKTWHWDSGFCLLLGNAGIASTFSPSGDVGEDLRIAAVL